jgi:hypothetical protein
VFTTTIGLLTTQTETQTAHLLSLLELHKHQTL